MPEHSEKNKGDKVIRDDDLGVTITKHGDDILTKGDALAERLELGGEVPDQGGTPIRYEVVKVPQGAALMVVAGLMSGLLGIGSGALKVMAMDYIMHLPLKISSAAMAVPMVSAPFSASFMLPVPEASMPAVEICSDRSAAGIITSARLTL